MSNKSRAHGRRRSTKSNLTKYQRVGLVPDHEGGLTSAMFHYSTSRKSDSLRTWCNCDRYFLVPISSLLLQNSDIIAEVWNVEI